MKLCTACSQWQMNLHQRRFEECVNVDTQIVQVDKADSKDQIPESECPSCWICLRAEPDESGQPVRRDCSCRGEWAGFAHLSCLIKYAESKSEQVDNNTSALSFQAWYTCHHCRQSHEAQLRVDLCKELMAFAERQYPGNREIYIEAQYCWLLALVDLNQEEAKEVARQLTSFIGDVETSSVTIIKAVVFGILGSLILVEGTKDSAKEAMVYFEKYRSAGKALGNANLVVSAELNISRAKRKYGENLDVSSDEELILSRSLYEQLVKSHGECSATTVPNGRNLAVALLSADHGIEAERLLTKLATISKRVLGPDHRQTQSVDEILGIARARKVRIRLGDELQRVQVLRYEEDGDKYAVFSAQQETFSVDTKDTYPILGTPVICHGMDSSPHLNGKIGDLVSRDEETDSFEVRFEDKQLGTCVVKRGNLRILFALPDV